MCAEQDQEGKQLDQRNTIKIVILEIEISIIAELLGKTRKIAPVIQGITNLQCCVVIITKVNYNIVLERSRKRKHHPEELINCSDLKL